MEQVDSCRQWQERGEYGKPARQPTSPAARAGVVCVSRWVAASSVSSPRLAACASAGVSIRLTVSSVGALTITGALCPQAILRHSLSLGHCGCPHHHCFRNEGEMASHTRQARRHGSRAMKGCQGRGHPRS